ncbi:hypothetical protein F0562_009371 [Nyssa sinensis]|uniref:Uncharacterized protein n=1 Tax=Nyssa sinensis TaxID=561372 RepID=A0A5J4ZZ17_9ASTE|nr:hypothetical protein F0562_009371 [Nyssa sinensis]
MLGKRGSNGNIRGQQSSFTRGDGLATSRANYKAGLATDIPGIGIKYLGCGAHGASLEDMTNVAMHEITNTIVILVADVPTIVATNLCILSGVTVRFMGGSGGDL